MTHLSNSTQAQEVMYSSTTLPVSSPNPYSKNIPPPLSTTTAPFLPFAPNGVPENKIAPVPQLMTASQNAKAKSGLTTLSHKQSSNQSQSGHLKCQCQYVPSEHRPKYNFFKIKAQEHRVKASVMEHHANMIILQTTAHNAQMKIDQLEKSVQTKQDTLRNLSINVKKNEAKLHTLEASIKTKQGLHASMMSVQEQLDKKIDLLTDTVKSKKKQLQSLTQQIKDTQLLLNKSMENKGSKAKRKMDTGPKTKLETKKRKLELRM